MSAPDPVSPLDRVFISYAHDDEAHEQNVRQLWTFLRSRGIDARIDLPAASRRQDWPIWMLREIRSARFVLIIASPEYRRRAEGDSPAEKGRGVQWEAALIREEVYADREASLKKYLSVVLPEGKASDIPSWLSPNSSTTYIISNFTDEGAEDLLRILTDQPREAIPPLGQRPRFTTTPLVGRPQTRDELLKKLLQRLSTRSRERSDAAIQADVRQILLVGDLGLTEDDLGVELRNQARDRRRIDIEKGNAILEVWRDLTDIDAARSAEQGLADYMAARPPSKHRRIAILTDGYDWRLYIYHDSRLQSLKTWRADPEALDHKSLLSWIEAVLATRRAIPPHRREIENKLGTSSPAHDLDIAELKAIYKRYHDMPAVQIKRELWAKLLTTAMGSHFTNDDSLFINHTLLAAMAKVIGHAVVGFQPEDPEMTAEVIMSGAMFTRAQITGVIEADFFDWIVDTPEGDRFIKDLARRLTRFAWQEVDRDIMKILYESIVSPETRRLLGEYYTPDWLAREIVAESVDNPLEQRVLDASCGSGTFLFYAVRHFLDAAEAAGMSDAAAIEQVARQVMGIDVHPVAVSLARVTYLLAIGVKRLRDPNRPSFAVPVYLGDSLRWGQEDTLYTYDGLIVPTTDDYEEFLTSRDLHNTQDGTAQLRFPDRVILDPQRFDRLITELAESATSRDRDSSKPLIRGILRRYDVHPDDRTEIERTFAAMCKLHDEERDHIWGYYVRNLARPHLLARRDNQVDVLVGNPPWLAYRFMTTPQQTSFRAMSRMRDLWTGSTVATSQQLAALFVVRCIELYLRPNGKFGFVMPHGVLSLKQYAGFRRGHYRIKA